MKATKKLLLFAFVATLMITMFAAFAITAAAEDSTLGFKNGTYVSEITYGETYDLAALSTSVLEQTSGELSGTLTDPVYKFVDEAGNEYVPGSNVGKYFLVLASAKIGGEDVAFNYEMGATGTLFATATLANNDKVRVNSGTVIVNPKSITVTLTGTVDSKVYDGTTDVLADQVTTGLTAEYTGLFAGDTLETVITGSYADKNVANGIALTLKVAIAGDKAANYVLENDVFTDKTADITPKELTVSLTYPSKVYGDADKLDYTLVGAVAGETPEFSGDLTRDAGETVGEYKVYANAVVLADKDSFKKDNYTVKADAGVYKITKAPLSIKIEGTFVFNNAEVAIDLTNTTYVTVTGLKGTDTLVGTVTTSADDVGFYGTGAGYALVNYSSDYNITALEVNYEIATPEVKIEITPLEIVVDLASTHNVTYDGTIRSITDSSSAFLTYSPAILGTSYSVTVSTSDKIVGEYSFVNGTLAITSQTVKDGEEDETNNYKFVVKADSTYKYIIEKAAITVTVTDNTKTYNAEAYVVDLTTVTVAPALFAGDAFTGTITTTFVNAGTYKTSDSTADTTGWTTNLDSNYEITWVVDVTINKAALTVTVNASVPYSGEKVTVNYDDARVTVEGLMSGHTLSAGMFVTSSANAGTYANAEAAWTTAIAVSDGVDDVTANYAITYAGNVEITKKVLTIETVTIANPYYYNGTNVLDAADVVVTFSGLVGSEALVADTDYTISDASWDGVNATTSGVKFTIALLSTAVADNYQIEAAQALDATGENGAIKKAVVGVLNFTFADDYDRYYDATKDIWDATKVTVNLQIKHNWITGKDYGAIVPADMLTVIFDADDIHWESQNAGTTKLILLVDDGYATLSNDNYEWDSSYISTGFDRASNKEIRPAKLYIVPDANQSKVYGTIDPDITFKYYVEGKNIADNANWNYDEVADIFNGNIIKADGENAGLYDYDQGTLALKTNGAFLVENYELTLPEEYFDAGNALDANKFEIVKRTIVVTPANANKVYWDAEPTLGYSFKADKSFDPVGAVYGGTYSDDNIWVYVAGTWTEITDKAAIFQGALVREGYNADRAQSTETIGKYNIVAGTLALLDDIAANYTLVVNETTEDNKTYTVTFDSAITDDKTATITVDGAHKEFTIYAAEIKFVAKNLEITYGDVFGTGTYKYYFNLVVENSVEAAILGDYKNKDLTYEDIDLLVDRALVLADGKTKFTFAPGFTCAYSNTDMVNAGIYTDMIKFYNESDVTLVVEPTNDVVLMGFEYGTLTVLKKDIKLAFENISVVYGTVDPQFTIVAADGYSFVGTDTFANSFQIETDKFRYNTTYSPTSSVGEYAITNNCNIAEAFYSNNYEVIPYVDGATLELTPVADQIKAGSITVTPKELVLVPYVGTFDPANIGSHIDKEYGASHDALNIKYEFVGLVGNQKANHSYTVKIVNDLGEEIGYNELDKVGTYKFVLESYSFTNDTESGFFAQNYTLVISGDVVFHIYAATLNLQGTLTGSDMIYNGKVDYNGTFDFSNVTDKGGIDITGLTFKVVAYFADKNVLNDGDAKPLTIVSIECTNDANYKVDFDPAALTAEAKIVKKAITATNITANDKVYDATDIATVFIPVNAKDIFADMIAGDDLKVAATAIFVNGKNVADNDGETDNVKITIALGGSDAGNYELTTTEIIDTAVITKATVTITGISAKDKVYDGLTNVEFVIDEKALIGVYDGDELYIANVEGVFEDANVGVEKAIVILTTLDGADLGNYKVAASSQTYANATITPATITVTLADLQKEYGYMINGYVDFSYTNSDFAELAGSELHSALEVNYTTTYDETVANKRKVGSYTIGATVVVKTMMNDDSVVSTNNYVVVVENATLAIYQAVLNVTVDTPAAIIYGDAIPTFTYSADGFKFDDDESVIIGTPVYNCTYMQGSGVGSYPVNLANNLYATNYVINYNGAFLTVNKATLTITPKDTTVVYGEGAKCDGYTVSGLLNGDTEAVISGTVTFGFVDFVENNGAVGEYKIVIELGNLLAANYDFNYDATGILTVEKATLTIKPNDATAVYGNAFVNNGYTFVGLVNGDMTVELSGDVGYAVDYVVGDDVGTYVITAVVDGLTTDNYVIVAGEGTLTVTKAALTIKAYANGTITYGDLAPAQNFYYYDAVAGLIDGDVLAEQVTGTAAYTTDYQQNSNAGNYNIYVTGLEAKNYEIEYVNGTLTVEKRELAVKPVDTTITFGDKPTCDGNVLVGLTPHDSALTLETLPGFAGELTFVYDYAQYGNVGTYTITSVVDAIESTNYYFVEAEGTLTVEAYVINGQILAKNKAVLDLIYGDKTPSYRIDHDDATIDVIMGANINGTYDLVGTFDGRYEEGDYVGTYTVTFTLADTTKNFVLGDITPATVNVAKRNITIIADDITVEYGDEPVYTVTFDGLADCDGIEVDGKIVLNDNAKNHITLNEVFTNKYTTSDPAGTVRPILMAGYVFESENYNLVAKVDGELTVIKRVIDVTVETLKVTYGEAIDLSKLTYVIENDRFVEGDTFESIFVPVVEIYTYATTNYTVGMTVAESGDVTITIKGIEAANYELNITYEGVEIEKRNVTLTINNFDVMYGEQPDQTGKFTLGAVYGEDKVNVTLVYVDYVAGAVNAGETCVIEATIDNPNYTVVYDAATLTVVKKTVTITIGNIDNTNKSVVYGNQVAQGTLSYADVVVEGFFGTQGITFDLYTDYDRYEDVGNYKISVDLETIVAKDGTNLDNYDIKITDGVLTVYKKETRITVELSSTTIYGEDPDFEVVFTKIARAEDVIIDLTKVTFVLNTMADGSGENYVPGSPVGTYYIIPVFNAEDVNKNYNLGINTVEFEVVAKSITVKANDNTIEFNQDPANVGYTAEGILAKDLADFEAALLYTYTYEKGDKAGEYVITVALNGEYENANYNFTFVEGKLTVTKIKIVVKVNVNAITYGENFNSDCQILNENEINGLVTGAPVYTTDYDIADPAKRGVGEYTVTVSGIDPVDADNYTVVYEINKLVVNKFAIKVIANNGTATYADAAAVVNGWKTDKAIRYAEDESIFNANFSIEYTYEQGVTVAGEYPITVKAVEETLANYDVTLVEGTLTVSRKALAFTLEAFDFIYYGNAEPTYVPVFADGAFYGDDTFENSFVGNLTIDAKGYAVGAPVGSDYEVTADVSKLYSDKYDIALDGTYMLVVNARPVTIKVDDKTMTYGDDLPEYTVSIGGEGFAPGHTLANLGTINEYYDTYDEGGDAGEYEINIVFTENATYAKNYAITFEPGKLTVEAKALVITPDELIKLKGAEDPEFTYSYTGLLEGETVEFIGALSREPGEEVGKYAITKGTLKVLSNNYTIVLEDAVFEIVGITITNKNLTLGLRDDIFMNYYFTVNVAGVVEFASGNDAFGILQWTEAEYEAVENYLFNEKYAYYGVYDSESHELKVNGQAIASTDYSKTFYARAYVKLADNTYVYGNVIAYSVADYADYFFKVDGQTEVKALLVALLDYGTTAQKYFDDKSVAANDIVTDVIREAVNAPKYDESMNPTVDSSIKKVDGADYNATIDWFGATASFGTTFKINFYGIAADDNYVVSGDDANFGIIYWTEADITDGKFDAAKATAATVTVDGFGRYMFTYDDIAAAEGADRIYAAMWVKDAEGKISYSRVTYMSIKDYAYTMMSLTDNVKYDDIVKLGQATIVYIEAAKSYFAD